MDKQADSEMGVLFGSHIMNVQVALEIALARKGARAEGAGLSTQKKRECYVSERE